MGRIFPDILVFLPVILPFILNPDTGLVNVSSKLDREQQDLFVLIVEVRAECYSESSPRAGRLRNAPAEQGVR